MKKSFYVFLVMLFISPLWAGGPKRVLVQAGKAAFSGTGPNVSVSILSKEAAYLEKIARVGTLPASQSVRTSFQLFSVSQSMQLDKMVRIQARSLMRTPLSSDEKRLFLNLYPFLPVNSSYAMKNNDWLEDNISDFKKKTKFVDENRTEILTDLRISPSSSVQDYMHFVQERDPQFIFLGEMHYRSSIQEELASFLKAYQTIYPNRKIVLFSEFLPSSLRGEWRKGEPIPSEFWAENPDYAGSAINEQAISGGIDIYGLEDFSLTHKIERACGLDFVEANSCLLSMAERNDGWAVVIEQVLSRMRLEDPNAVFIVHAGNAHVDKTRFYSLSEKLKYLNPFVIQFSNGFQNSMLGYLLGQDPSYMARVSNRYVLSWGEAEKDFSSQIGFDLNILLPVSEKELIAR